MSEKKQTSQHHIYVIELDKEVLKFDDFMFANPDYKDGMPCLFVGETRYSPKKRFNYHLVGYKSHDYIRRYARRLAPEYYSSLNPVDANRAKEVENHLAAKLRSTGYAVWQHADVLNSRRLKSRHSHSPNGHMYYHFVSA